MQFALISKCVSAFFLAITLNTTPAISAEKGTKSANIQLIYLRHDPAETLFRDHALVVCMSRMPTQNELNPLKFPHFYFDWKIAFRNGVSIRNTHSGEFSGNFWSPLVKDAVLPGRGRCGAVTEGQIRHWTERTGMTAIEADKYFRPGNIKSVQIKLFKVDGMNEVLLEQKTFTQIKAYSVPEIEFISEDGRTAIEEGIGSANVPVNELVRVALYDGYAEALADLCNDLKLIATTRTTAEKSSISYSLGYSEGVLLGKELPSCIEDYCGLAIAAFGRNGYVRQGLLDYTYQR